MDCYHKKHHALSTARQGEIVTVLEVCNAVAILLLNPAKMYDTEKIFTGCQNLSPNSSKSPPCSVKQRFANPRLDYQFRRFIDFWNYYNRDKHRRHFAT